MQSLPILEYRLRQGVAKVRPVSGEEKELVKRFFESLDPDTIYLRFLHPVRDFTRYVETIFRVNRYGVIVIAELEGQSIGLGELIAKEKSVGEIAVTVRQEFRRQGLGTYLTAYLAYAAHVKGVEYVEAYILSENIAARRIAEKLGLRMEYVGTGVYRIRVRVDQVLGYALKTLGLRGK